MFTVTYTNGKVTTDGKVTRTERGWQGHFCCPCEFHRNTLLECGDIRVVISTVGLYRSPIHYGEEEYEEIGAGRYFETMAFHAEGEHGDPVIEDEVQFDSEWAISEGSWRTVIKANEMHEAVVTELTQKLLRGEDIDD